MNDPPLLTPYWSSAFAKQMKPPTLAPYMVALLCMGPCHGQAHTRDPTIGFSPPALLYLLLVIFSAWCKQCLTFPPFFFFLCHVEHFAVSKLQTLILFLFSRKKNESQHFTLTAREMMSYSGRFFIAGGLYAFIARARHVVQPEGQELTFSKCLRRLPSLCGFLQRTGREGRERERWKPV